MTVTIEEGNRRLLVLAEFLEKLPAAKFEYGGWGEGEPACPTTACALGWCPSIPEFAGQIELFREFGYSDGDISVRLVGDDTDIDDLDAFDTSLEAATEFFSLDDESARYVFIPAAETDIGVSPPQVATALEVAAHIRRFVASRS
jgi:hypothetical protein